MKKLILAVVVVGLISLTGCATVNKTSVVWTDTGVEVYSKKGTAVKFKDGEHKEVSVDDKSSNLIKDFVAYELQRRSKE